MTIQEARDRVVNLTDRQRSLILSAMIGRIEGSEHNKKCTNPKAHVLGMLERSIETWENMDREDK